jgi:hypothetical protein
LITAFGVKELKHLPKSGNFYADMGVYRRIEGLVISKHLDGDLGLGNSGPGILFRPPHKVEQEALEPL